MVRQKVRRKASEALQTSPLDNGHINVGRTPLGARTVPDDVTACPVDYVGDNKVSAPASFNCLYVGGHVGGRSSISSSCISFKRIRITYVIITLQYSAANDNTNSDSRTFAYWICRFRHWIRTEHDGTYNSMFSGGLWFESRPGHWLQWGFFSAPPEPEYLSRHRD
jgi:hypothetical protein